jgi:hypothetical protein
VVSANREQATDRIRAADAILTALNIDHNARTTDILIPKHRLRFAVYTASIAGVSGFTAIGALLDEVTKWKDSETGVNPAREVIASIKPTMITQPDSMMYMVSSPWATLDAHYEYFERGDEGLQWTAQAPTWVANPSVTEQATHDLEPDEEIWRREYAAIPMSSEARAFFHTGKLTESVRPALAPFSHGHASAIGADFAFKRDASAAVYATIMANEIWITDAVEHRPLNGPLRPSVVIRDIGEFTKKRQVGAVMADLHYSESVREYLDEFAIELQDVPPGQDGVNDMHLAVRACLNADRLRIAVPGELGKRLLQQLKDTVGIPTPTGMKIHNPRLAGSHGDMGRAAVTAVYQLVRGIGLEYKHTAVRRNVEGPESTRPEEFHDTCPDSE